MHRCHSRTCNTQTLIFATLLAQRKATRLSQLRLCQRCLCRRRHDAPFQRNFVQTWLCCEMLTACNPDLHSASKRHHSQHSTKHRQLSNKRPRGMSATVSEEWELYCLQPHLQLGGTSVFSAPGASCGWNPRVWYLFRNMQQFRIRHLVDRQRNYSILGIYISCMRTKRLWYSSMFWIL